MKKKHEIASEVVLIHEQLRSHWPHLRRIAVALYDPSTDELFTFVNSTEGLTILPHYVQKLADVPSLSLIANTKTPRIIEDLSIFEGSLSAHSQAILTSGFKSSYTIPIYDNVDVLMGFIFFDSDETGYFSNVLQESLATYCELLRSFILADILPLKMLTAALNITRAVTRYRDEETGEHIIRMSHYSRLIARGLADTWKLSDQFIQYVFMYAPLHDIGKVGVPDSVLLKPGRLDAEEFAIMQTHVSKGIEIVDALIHEFGLGENYHSDILHNIVAYHHEKCDGTGYLASLQHESIPYESRIVTVADVFDALTSDRPYHRAWSIDEAFKYLQERINTDFDPLCVEVLISSRKQIEAIKQEFT